MGCCKGWANLNLTYRIPKRLSPGWESRRQVFWGWKWESEFLARLIRSLGSPRGREGSGALKKEIGAWSSQGGEKDKHFSLSPELMTAQQNNSSFWVQFSSIAQSCPTLCDPMDCSTPGLPVHHQLPELLQLMSIESVTPSTHLILCCPFLLPPSIFPSIRVFSNELALRIRWPKYWSFSFNISPSNEHPGLISFRMDSLNLLAVQGTLKSLLQHHSSKVSILWCSAFFIPNSHIHTWILEKP